MRRDKNDEKWQECKQIVYDLDKSQCLLCQCMTVAESIAFTNSGPIITSKIDPAHYKPVSLRPDIMYDPDNVFCICRAHHERLDNCKNPITNEHCSKDVTESFWQRIIAKRKENQNKNVKELPMFFDDI